MEISIHQIALDADRLNYLSKKENKTEAEFAELGVWNRRRFKKFMELGAGDEIPVDYYQSVWRGEVSDKGIAEHKPITHLEIIFEWLNIGDKPVDYRGHSLSISDIVVFWGEVGEPVKAFYCQRVGWSEVEVTLARDDKERAVWRLVE